MEGVLAWQPPAHVARLELTQADGTLILFRAAGRMLQCRMLQCRACRASGAVIATSSLGLYHQRCCFAARGRCWWGIPTLGAAVHKDREGGKNLGGQAHAPLQLKSPGPRPLLGEADEPAREILAQRGASIHLIWLAQPIRQLSSSVTYDDKGSKQFHMQSPQTYAHLLRRLISRVYALPRISRMKQAQAAVTRP